MIPSDKTGRCLSATSEMSSWYFEIPNVKFPLLVSKLFRLHSQPTPPPPLSLSSSHSFPHSLPCLVTCERNAQAQPAWQQNPTDTRAHGAFRCLWCFWKLFKFMVETHCSCMDLTCLVHLAKALERSRVSLLSSSSASLCLPVKW